MNSTPNPTSTFFLATIVKHLPLAEKIFFLALVIGTVLTSMHVDSPVRQVALVGLGITFFLLAYRPMEIPPQEDGQIGGFTELLALSIVPKVLWMGCAVSALGLAFYLFGNKGYKQLLIIGGSTIGGSSVLLIVFLAQGVKHLNIVTPILLRAIPLLLADFYILFR